MNLSLTDFANIATIITFIIGIITGVGACKLIQKINNQSIKSFFNTGTISQKNTNKDK